MNTGNDRRWRWTAARPIRLALALLAIAAAGILVWRAVARSWPGTPDAPAGTLWLCGNPECARDFSLSTRDLAAFYDVHPDGSPPCPACGKAVAARAVRCAGCGKAFVPPARSAQPSTRARACPHCGRPMR